MCHPPITLAIVHVPGLGPCGVGRATLEFEGESSVPGTYIFLPDTPSQLSSSGKGKTP